MPKKALLKQVISAASRRIYPHPPQCAHWGTFPQGKVILQLLDKLEFEVFADAWGRVSLPGNAQFPVRKSRFVELLPIVVIANQ